MINNLKLAVAVCCVVFMSSCATVSYLNIDVLEPARINFPPSIVNIAIVDNAGAQLQDSIPNSINTEPEILTSYTKSVFKESLVQFLGEEKYFNEVKIYPEALRMDKQYGMQQMLLKKDITDIAKVMDVDAIISIDAFNVTTKEKMEYIDYSLVNIDLTTVELLFRVFDANGQSLAPPFATADSVAWLAASLLPIRNKEIFQNIALTMSEGMMKQIVPSWESKERWIFTDGTSLMKKAKRHADLKEWSDAGMVWGAAFDSEKNDVKKAKIASNIALANENLDDIENAVTWINIAYDLIKGNHETNDNKRIIIYKLALDDRLEATPKLLEQLQLDTETQETQGEE